MEMKKAVEKREFVAAIPFENKAFVSAWHWTSSLLLTGLGTCYKCERKWQMNIYYKYGGVRSYPFQHNVERVISVQE